MGGGGGGVAMGGGRTPRKLGGGGGGGGGAPGLRLALHAGLSGIGGGLDGEEGGRRGLAKININSLYQ